jgi:hypothetical protein
LIAGRGESGDADFQRVAGAHGDLFPEQEDGIIEGITLDDPGLAH